MGGLLVGALFLGGLLGPRPAPLRAQAAPTPSPPAIAPAAQALLPLLASDGGPRACSAWVAVQNLGPEAGKVVFLSWDRPGACGPAGSGPIDVDCSGLLAPGSRWSFALDAQAPLAGSGVGDGSHSLSPSARSGAVFSFNVLDVTDDDIVICDTNSDLMCETLYFGVQRDPEEYGRFKQAFDEGADYAGLSMPAVAGSPIQAQVYRRCATADGSPATDLYGARAGAGAELRPRSELFGDIAPPWDYHVPLVSAASDGASPARVPSSERVYLQNSGWACASVEVWAHPLGGCGLEQRQGSLELAPGEQAIVEAGAIRFPELGDLPAGSLRLSSDQRLALVTETRGPDWLASTELLAGAEALVGPLLRIDPAEGWTTRLHLLDPSEGSNALQRELRIRVTDAAGDPLAEQRISLCPYGLRVIDLADLVPVPPPAGLGAVRVEAELTAPVRSPAAVVALAELIHVDASGRIDAVARYPLEPVVPWIDAGTGLLALPILGHAPASEIPPARLVLHDANPNPGYTDAAVYTFDRNGLIGLSCHRLNAGQSLTIDPAALPQLAPGFDGSALVSASYWEHSVADPTVDPDGDRPWLAATLIERWPTDRGPTGGRDINAARAIGLDALPDALASRLPPCLGRPLGPIPATPAPGQP
ncbi:MAG: hypothetical protein KDH92_13565, partial [Chloroflexi bacterium]|nr:hypothetical protein [Chloroflexota bacterium]